MDPSALRTVERGAAGPKVLKVNSRLREHDDPCVIWIFWDWDTTARRVRLEYRYSPQEKWPDPDPGEPPIFELRNTHFLPDLNIAQLAVHLFDFGPGTE